MDWSERMNAAIAYIEDNLEGDIDFDKAAEKAACSGYHFQRVFFAINGMTPADYARRRKLTLAAAELSYGNARVIDVAMKYGYDSPNAFTRAYRQLHGLTPTDSREPGVTLTACPRISFHIELKGGNLMDYKLIEKPAFTIMGRSRQFSFSNGINATGTGNFWNEYGPTAECQRLFNLGEKPGPVTGARILGAALLIDGHYDPFRYAICIEKTPGVSQEDFEVHQIPAATWAVFDCTLEMLPAVVTRVFSEWFPSTGYEHEMKPNIEVYFVDRTDGPQPSHLRCQYWVPVIRKTG